MLAAQRPSLNYKALSWTVGVHVLILLLLLLWRYSTPVSAPQQPELGMEVNLGTSADGSGTDQPMDMDDPADAVAVNNRASAAREESSDREVERTDDADAPEVAPPRRTTTAVRPAQQTNESRVRHTVNTPQPATTATTTAPQVQRPRFVYQGGTGKGGNGAAENAPGGNEGNTFGSGDRGVPHGTPGASNYTGSPGTGTGGISHSLGNRSIVAFPPKEAEFREGGKVVVRVTVNREGTIVSKQIVSASNPELRPIALRKVQSVRFNKSEQAPAEQFGTITFVFKTRS